MSGWGEVMTPDAAVTRRGLRRCGHHQARGLEGSIGSSVARGSAVVAAESDAGSYRHRWIRSPPPPSPQISPAASPPLWPGGEWRERERQGRQEDKGHKWLASLYLSLASGQPAWLSYYGHL